MSDLFWVGLIVLCAVCSRCVFVIRPFDSDSSMFIYMGRLIAEGGRFQHEIIDNKFPTVGLLMSVPWRILGSHWIAWVMLGAVLSALASWRLATAATNAFGPSAWRAALLASIVLLNFNFTVFGGFQLETIHIFFTAIAAAAAIEALRRDSALDTFVVGLAAAMGAYAKPTALSVAIAFAAFCTLRYWRRPARLIAHGLACLLGAALPLIAFVIYLIGSDNLRDMPGLYQQISLYAKNSVWNLEDLNKPVTVLILGGFPFLVRGWIFRRQKVQRESQSRFIVPFISLWFLLELIGVVMQRRMYAYHFMPIAAPLALLFAAVPRRDDLRTITAALLPLSLFSMIGAANVLSYGYEPNGTLLASDYLRTHAVPGERVWQDDSARLLIETGLQPGSRHPLTFLFANDNDAPLRYSQNILQDFDACRPRYIVLPTDLKDYVAHQQKYILELDRVPARKANYATAWDAVGNYVQQHYTPCARVGGQTVWIRREESNRTPTDVASSPISD